MIPITPIPITSGIITLAALNLEHTKNFEMFWEQGLLLNLVVADLARLVAQQVLGILLSASSTGILGIVQVALHCCDKYHDQKAAWRGSILFGLHVLIIFVRS